MTLGYILAAVIGFLIALLRSQYRKSQTDKLIDETVNKISREKGELDDAQKKANEAVEDYLKSIGDIDDGPSGNA